METYPELGIYEHYKSTPENRRYYEVIDFARHTETGEPLVLYKPLYEHRDPTGLTNQARPLNIFMQEVEVDGVATPRFRYMGLELVI